MGAKEVEVALEAGDTVGSVLRALSTAYPALGERLLQEDGSLHSSIHVLVNGRNIRFLEGLDTAIQEADQLALFPPVGGG